ncbi:MAG: caspase family protein [Candidatus Brocadiia bacterium]
MRDDSLRAEYTDSHALIIGVDRYRNASSLNYAVNDAQAVAELLQDSFGFDRERVVLLTDESATREQILAHYLQYANPGQVERNDRILVFYAGHGHTVEGQRRGLGFLIPHDGDAANLSSLISWRELTLKADLIPAKHIFFIMDACYGGLAITRAAAAPGSTRFLKDMHLRPSRQVLTAGKADEKVADSGGPRPGHSVFTGYLLDALEEGARTTDGIITASGVMSYVYDRVSRDPDADQSPHFGFLEGDGDFIFVAPPLPNLAEDDRRDEDLLIELPGEPVGPAAHPNGGVVLRAKQLLSEPRNGPRLHDFLHEQVAAFVAEATPENFPVTSGSRRQDTREEEFRDRLRRYEQAVMPMQRAVVCVARWGQDKDVHSLCNALARCADPIQRASGSALWLELQWYPLIVLAYSWGIAAVSGSNYHHLAKLYAKEVSSPESRGSRRAAIWTVGEVWRRLLRTDAFKTLPGYERKYTPLSEYLYKRLQPEIDDILHLGKDYERYFDRYEVITALAHADARVPEGWGIWGPIGRFGWKYSSRRTQGNPLSEIVAEARAQEARWPPLQAGLFGGDFQRFTDVADEYMGKIASLSWF